MSFEPAQIATPEIEAALAAMIDAAPEKTDNQYRRPSKAMIQRRLADYTDALATLNKGIAEQKIWNQALEGVKYGLNNGIERALEFICAPITEKFRMIRDQDGPRNPLIDAWDDISHYCQFNQAAGRRKRLLKRKDFTALVKLTPQINGYLDVLAEVEALNLVIAAVKPFIVKGRRPAENPTVVDLSNTATCAICFRTQKLNAGGQMVHHGFKISDGAGYYYGFRSGSCFGVGYLPYEKSCKANHDYRKGLEAHLVGLQGSLSKHKAGEVLEVSRLEWQMVEGRHRQVPVPYKQGEPKYPEVLEQTIARIERDIDHVKLDIQHQTSMIDKWVLKPVYDELHPKKAEA